MLLVSLAGWAENRIVNPRGQLSRLPPHSRLSPRSMYCPFPDNLYKQGHFKCIREKKNKKKHQFRSVVYRLFWRIKGSVHRGKNTVTEFSLNVYVVLNLYFLRFSQLSMTRPSIYPIHYINQND